MTSKRYSLIVATSENMAIGRGNRMPWHISADLKYFKKLTKNGTVIMGRHTWESLGCKPLPLRENIIVSRSLTVEKAAFAAVGSDVVASGSVGGSVGGGAAVEDVAGAAATVTMVAPSIEEALKMASRDEIFVIGGGEIYRQTMPGAYRLYITSVKTIIDDADTYFPKIDSSKWRIIWESEVFHDTKTNFDFQFIQYLTNEN